VTTTPRSSLVADALPLALYAGRPGDVKSFSYVSPRVEELFEHPAAAWREDEFLERVLHPDDRERLLAERNALLAGGEASATLTYRIATAAGAYVWVRDDVVALDGEGGRPHLQGVLSDITEAVHRQRELDAVRRINDLLTAQPAVDELAVFVGLLVEETLRPELTVVALYDTDDESLSYPFANESGERVLEPTSAIARDAISAVIRDRTIVGNAGGSFVGVPIRAGEEAIGVLAVESPGATRFDEADAHLLAAIAVGIAPTIHSAHLLRALRESEWHYRRLVDAIPVAMYRASEGEQNSSEYMSPRAVAMFGYPLEAWSDPDFFGQVLHPDDRDWVLAENDLPLTDDESIWVSDYRMVTADGRTIWIHDESWTVRDEDGNAQFVQGCMIDVTEQKEAEAKLAAALDEIGRQKQYFEALVEVSPVAVVVTDPDERVTGWNPAATALFGYVPEETVGRTIGDLLLADGGLGDEGAEVSREALASGKATRITKRSRKDGSLVPVEMLMAALAVDGEHTGYYAIYHDITELLRAQEEAEAMAEAKSTFLATMSHEIRTPMNAVIGMTGLLLDTELDSEQRGFAQVISTSGDALLHVIDDILDYSKIEAGMLDLEKRPFEVRDCVEGALTIVAPRAVGKDVELACLIEDDVPAFVIGDSTRLRQVLLNLLSNAIKFTELGEIIVAVGRPKAGWLDLSVRDTGIGIPKDKMHRLFESFSQVDASTTRKYGGTGLGLAISLRIVELMGGTIDVESQPGVGTTFRVTIPADAAEQPVPTPYARSSQPGLEGRRVLIVDDNATNREILSRQTASWGMLPEAIELPTEALIRLRRGENYDLAILDMQMPELDGLTLAREIRRLRETLPLVLATSLDGLQTGRSATEIAVQLTKPVRASALYEALLDALGVAENLDELEAGDVSTASQVSTLRILAAEDNAVNQRVAKLILAKLGYTADMVANGLEALAALTEQRYDVVLMDVQMPELDGLETTRRIISTYGVERPRIVAMTANAMESDREECFAAGMDDYIAKPIRPNELAAALARCKPSN
jgi:PAS domain S-box-containing protein